MSDINPSLVSSELTTIETFKDTTEKRGSKLTLNELNYISDKQLHQKTDGEGGGLDSPLKLAKVTFVADDPSMNLEDCFLDFLALPVYRPGNEYHAETAGVLPSNTRLAVWNAGMDDESGFLITPYILYKKSGVSYTLEGSAESGSEEDGDYIYITGDCTITIDASVND